MADVNSLLQLLGVGLAGFNTFEANKANQEANRKTRRSTSLANAINSFGGNAQAQQFAPELDGFAQAGQAAQAGLGAFQQFKSLLALSLAGRHSSLQ